MHEMSIAQAILGVVENELERHGLSRAAVVRVKVGQLSGVVPHSLTFCWRMVSEDGPAAGSTLEIIDVPARARCLVCDSEFEVRDFVFVCPDCQSTDLDLLTGRELTVDSLEAD